MSNEQDKAKHGKRLQRAWAVIKRQLKIAKSIGNTKYIDQPHRLIKHHAADCGQPGCVICGNRRKVFGEKTVQEEKFDKQYRADQRAKNNDADD